MTFIFRGNKNNEHLVRFQKGLEKWFLPSFFALLLCTCGHCVCLCDNTHYHHVYYLQTNDVMRDECLYTKYRVN